MYQQTMVLSTRGRPHSNDKRYAAEGHAWASLTSTSAVQGNTTPQNPRVRGPTAQQQSPTPAVLLLSQGGLAQPPPRVCALLSWAPTGVKPRGTMCSQVLPSTRTSLSLSSSDPSEDRRLYLIQPQSAWPQLRAQEPHTPRDGNLTSGPNLPTTKSSSCEKQRCPLRPSPRTQVQRTSNFASSRRGAMSARQISELRTVPGT